MDYLVKIRSVQTPLNGQFSIGANTNGAKGATGASGAAGATGEAGPAGASGTNGTNGATGEAGPAGASGTNGTNGATGQAGPAGASGTNGTNGAAGASGTNGTNGAPGATGATGPDSESALPTYTLGGTGPSDDGFKVIYLDGPGRHGIEAPTYDKYLQAVNAGGIGATSATVSYADAQSIAFHVNDTSRNGINLSYCTSSSYSTNPGCWHLPTRTELAYVFEQRVAVILPTTDSLWSSTTTLPQSTYVRAWMQDNKTGAQTQSATSRVSADLMFSLPVRTF